MQLSVCHRTTYRYSRPVFPEPHFLRLRPRSDPAQEVLRYVLRVSPTPAGRSEGLDPEGNWLTCIWFEDLVEELELVAEFSARTLRSNPFDFLLSAPEFSPDAPLYPAELAGRLGPCLTPLGCRTTAALARGISHGGTLVDYLLALNQKLHASCRVVVRESGDPWPPERTLSQGRGACRDLAVVFIEACRSVGVAARFASGFQGGDVEGEGEGAAPARFLHAWAEAYLPGAGWRGFDPTLGLAVTDSHICVAASSTYFGAAPLSGTFRGSDATSLMETEIRVDRE